jgi:hypothetical protein
LDDSRLEEIGDEAFRSCKVEKIEIKARIVKFGGKVFSDCSRLKEIKLHRVEKIGANSLSPLSVIQLPAAMADSSAKPGIQKYSDFWRTLANPDLMEAFPRPEKITRTVDVKWFSNPR